MKIEDKLRIFAHYLCCQARSGKADMPVNVINTSTGCISSGIESDTELPAEDCKLILKPLSRITRRDAQRCAELAGLPSSLYKTWEVQQRYDGKIFFCFPGVEDNYRNMVEFSEDKLSWRQVDYLRSQGYAIGISKDFYIEEI